MLDHVQVDLVTPERQFASLEAKLVEVPGTVGDFGVLPGHSPLISTIRAGVVTVHMEANVRQRYLVMGGVAEVTNERCTILGEYLEDISSVTREQADARLATAKKAEEAAITEEEKRNAARQQHIAEVLCRSFAV